MPPLLPEVQVAARHIHRGVGAVVVTGLGLGRSKDLGVLSTWNVEPLGARGRPACPDATSRPSHNRRTLPAHHMPIGAQAHVRAWPQATCWRGPRFGAS